MSEKNVRIIYDDETTKQQKEQMYAEFLKKEQRSVVIGKYLLIVSVILIAINTAFSILRDYSLTRIYIKEMFFEYPDEYSVDFTVLAVLFTITLIHIILTVLTVITAVKKAHTKTVLIISASFICICDLLTSMIIFSSGMTYDNALSVVIAAADAVFFALTGIILYTCIARNEISKYVYEQGNT